MTYDAMIAHPWISNCNWNKILSHEELAPRGAIPSISHIRRTLTEADIRKIIDNEKCATILPSEQQELFKG